MSSARAASVGLIALGALAAGPRGASAQGAMFEVVYGAWFADDDTSARVLHAGLTNRLLGPLGWGVGFAHVQDTRDSLSRSFSGAEFSLSLWRHGSGPYVLASTGFGVRHRGGTDMFWSAGAGYQVRLLRLFTLGLEARYRVEDTRMRGFWNLDPTDRGGVQVAGRLSFGIGREHGARATVPPGDQRVADGPEPPTERGAVAERPSLSTALPVATDPYAIARASGAAEEAARLTASVVETALAAMGSPYQWGGTSANGFDCSGLIQFSYAKHGVLLPRVSRDQARMGQAVTREVSSLRPGDILAFSSAGTSSNVTHVGLYVGNGQFIHSSGSGVKLSQLEAGDGDSRWWRDRWVGARRIVE